MIYTFLLILLSPVFMIIARLFGANISWKAIIFVPPIFLFVAVAITVGPWIILFVLLESISK